jgi:hypothetical protein
MKGISAVPGKEAKTIGENVQRSVIEDFLNQNPGIRRARHEG